MSPTTSTTAGLLAAMGSLTAFRSGCTIPVVNDSGFVGRLRFDMEKISLIIFTVAGLASIAFGIYSIPGTISLVINSETTEGTVVDVSQRPQMEGGPTYAPTVTFVTKDGRSIKFTSNVSSGSWKDRIGESVTVRYDLADPANARIDSLSQLWGGSIIPIGLGLAFVFGSRWFFGDEHRAG